MTGAEIGAEGIAPTDWEHLPGVAAPEAFSAWLIADLDGETVRSASMATTQLHGRIVDTIPLAGAAARLRRHVGRPILIVDVGAGAEATVATDLAEIVSLADAHGWPLVLAMPKSRIDLVMSVLGRRDAQLLCEPLEADWIGAVAVAAAARLPVPGPSDAARESEAARRARLNQDMARVAEALLNARGRGDGAAHGPDRRTGYVPEPQSIELSATLVRDVIRARRLRDRHFAVQLFEDPAWDIILDLFAARLERAQVSVSSLCIAAAVAPTTALRWIQKLSDAGLLEREPDPFDKRRAFMKLSPEAVSSMTRYVAMLHEMRLPMV